MMRYTRTQHRPASRQVNDHGRVSGTHSKDDPLYRARKLLVSASERITDNGHTRLRGLLDAGDPYGEVRDAWHAKETLRSVYDIPCAKTGAATVAQLAADFQEPGMPEEINRLGRTLWRWREQISNWHATRVTNACGCP